MCLHQKIVKLYCFQIGSISSDMLDVTPGVPEQLVGLVHGTSWLFFPLPSVETFFQMLPGMMKLLGMTSLLGSLGLLGFKADFSSLYQELRVKLTF